MKTTTRRNFILGAISAAAFAPRTISAFTKAVSENEDTGPGCDTLPYVHMGISFGFYRPELTPHVSLNAVMEDGTAFHCYIEWIYGSSAWQQQAITVIEGDPHDDCYDYFELIVDETENRLNGVKQTPIAIDSDIQQTVDAIRMFQRSAVHSNFIPLVEFAVEGQS